MLELAFLEIGRTYEAIRGKATEEKRECSVMTKIEKTAMTEIYQSDVSSLLNRRNSFKSLS